MIRFPIAAAVCLAALLCGCAKKEAAAPDLPVILKIDGEPVYMDELNLLGRLAVSKDGILFDSDEGQERYKEIAPNLYSTLIDLYVIQKAAKREGIEPPPEEVEAEYQKFIQTMRDANALENFQQGLGVDDERLRETVRDNLAMNIFQMQKFEEGKREPTDEEMKMFYHEHNADFRFPNRLRASHIFIRVEEDATEAQRAQAAKRMEEIKAMVDGKPGENFVKLARLYSEDPGTAPRGGDLGFFTISEPKVPEPFKKAAFELPLGGVSGVVMTYLGAHLIWVTDHEQSLEEAKDELKRVMTQKSMVDYFLRWKELAREGMNIERYFDPETFEVLDKPVETEA